MSTCVCVIYSLYAIYLNVPTYIRTYTYVLYIHMGEHCTVHVCLRVLGILYVHLTEHIRSQ